MNVLISPACWSKSLLIVSVGWGNLSGRTNDTSRTVYLSSIVFISFFSGFKLPSGSLYESEMELRAGIVT